MRLNAPKYNILDTASLSGILTCVTVINCNGDDLEHDLGIALARLLYDLWVHREYFLEPTSVLRSMDQNEIIY